MKLAPTRSTRPLLEQLNEQAKGSRWQVGCDEQRRANRARPRNSPPRAAWRWPHPESDDASRMTSYLRQAYVLPMACPALGGLPLSLGRTPPTPATGGAPELSGAKSGAGPSGKCNAPPEMRHRQS